MSLELDDIASGFTSTKINSNFEKIEEWINLNALWRQGVESGQANQMETNLDMNGFSILNASTDLNSPNSILTVAEGDSRYLNVLGDSMEGALDMSSNPIYVREAVSFNEPARKGELDSERSQRQSNDSSLQNQLSGLSPIAAAERPVIQWHSNTLDNSVAIPDSVNAFSAGPFLTLADGVEVTVGNNSIWSVLGGEVQNG